MRRKDLFKRLTALSLAFVLTFTSVDVSVFASEPTSEGQVETLSDSEAVVSEAPPAEETVVETPPSTEVPVQTEPPQTDPPQTDPTVTEAPVTEAPMTETPVTEQPPTETLPDDTQTETTVPQDDVVSSPETNGTEGDIIIEDVIEVPSTESETVVSEAESESETETEVETETETETETEKVLESYVFDLADASVSVVEEEGSFTVTVGEDVYTDVENKEFTFTGNSSSNEIYFNVNSEVKIIFENLSLKGGVTPVGLDGNGKYNVELKGKNKVLTSQQGGAAIRVAKDAYLSLRGKGTLEVDGSGGTNTNQSFIRPRLTIDGTDSSDSEVPSNIQYEETEAEEVKGNYGAAIGGAVGEECGSISINCYGVTATGGAGSNGIGSGRDGKQGTIKVLTGNVNAKITGAVDSSGTSLYPVMISSLQPDREITPSILVNGMGYDSGTGRVSEDGRYVIYLPVGDIEVSVNGVTYSGKNTECGVILEEKKETEAETEVGTEAMSESEGTVSYDNIALESSIYTLFLDKESGMLSTEDMVWGLTASKSGTKDADKFISTIKVELPEGITLPKELVVSEETVINEDGVEWFRVSKEKRTTIGNVSGTEIEESSNGDVVLDAEVAETSSEMLDTVSETEVKDIPDYVKFIRASIDENIVTLTIESSDLEKVSLSFVATNVHLEKGLDEESVIYVQDGALDGVDVKDIPEPKNGRYFLEEEARKASKYLKLKKIENIFALKGIEDYINVSVSSVYEDKELTTSEEFDVVDGSIYIDSEAAVFATKGDEVGIVSISSGFPAEYAYGNVSLRDDRRVINKGSAVSKNNEGFYIIPVSSVSSKNNNAYIDFENAAEVFSPSGNVTTKYDVRAYFWVGSLKMPADNIMIANRKEYNTWVVQFSGKGDGWGYESVMQESDTKYGTINMEYHFYTQGHVGDSAYEVPFKGVMQVADLDGGPGDRIAGPANQQYIEAVSFKGGVANTSQVYAMPRHDILRVQDDSATWAKKGTWFYGTQGQNGAPSSHKNSVWTLVDASATNPLKYTVRTSYTYGTNLKSYYGLFGYHITNLHDMLTNGVITATQEAEINKILDSNSGYFAAYARWIPALTNDVISNTLSSYGLTFDGWYSSASCTPDTAIGVNGILIPGKAKDVLPKDHDGWVNEATIAYGRVSAGSTVTVTKSVSDPSGFGHTARNGWSFNLSGNGINVNAVTGANGVATFTDVNNGTYTMSEYVNTNVWDTTVSKSVTVNGDTNVSWYNVYKTGSVEVIKTVSDPSGASGVGRQGFVYNLKGTSTGGDSVNVNAVTNTNGVATFVNIPVGYYTVSEVGTPDSPSGVPSWWASSAAVGATVTYGGKATVNFTNTYKTGNVKVTKKVVDASGFITNPSGFKFSLTGTSTSGKVINRTGITDTNGICNFTNIPIGNYVVTEIGTQDSVNSVPSWWRVDSVTNNVSVTYGNTSNVNVTNTYKVGNVKVVKTIEDPSGQYTTPDGFKVTLTGTSTSGKQINKSGVTDAKGEILFSNIPIGTYTITEVGTKNNPNAIDSWWDVHTIAQTTVITEGTTSQVNIKNINKTGDVLIKKELEDPSNTIKNASGFVFRLHGTSASGYAIDKTGVTNENGEYTFKNIPIGQYTVDEVGTPDDNSKINSWWDALKPTGSVTVGYKKVSEYPLKNIYKTGNLEIQKVIEEVSPDDFDTSSPEYNNSKAGFAFRLKGTSDAGNDIELYAVSDADGKVKFENVPVGTKDNYTLVEVRKSDVIAAANAGNASALAVKANVTQELEQYVTPKSLKVSINYDANAHKQLTTVIDKYENILVKWRITITKEDMHVQQAGKPQQSGKLDGAVYGLYYGDKLIDTYVTDKNASFTTDYYILGSKWYFKELKGSEGYLADNKKYPVKASAQDITSGVEFNEAFLDESVEIDGDVNVVYEPIKRGSCKYYKVSGDTFETDKGWLRGAGFSVYSLTDVEKIFSLKSGQLYNATNDEVVQWFFDNVRDVKTQNYDKMIGLDTALVYADAEDDDVKNGSLAKSFRYANGETVTAPNEKNAYRVSEIVSGDDGVVKTPRLPYGKYVIIETTVPNGYVAAAPRVITIDHDDKDKDILGDKGGTPCDEAVVWDSDVTAYIAVAKSDKVSGSMIRKDGAKYVIHDLDGAYFDWYMKDRTTEEKKAYKDKFGDLVVDYSDGYRGSYGSPYTVSEKLDENGFRESWYVRTNDPLPEGRYEIEEVGAPKGYVLQGFEGIYRVDKNGNRFYEIEDDNDNKWLNYHLAVNADMVGKSALNEEVASPKNRVTVSISPNTVEYNSSVRGFFVTVGQYNEPAVGKVSVYTEGQYLTGTYPTDEGGLGFEYEYRPISDAVYSIYANGTIYTQDGTNTILYNNGDFVTRLITNDRGQAWTEELVTSSGDKYYGLPLGSYIIKETKAGEGFALSNDNKYGKRFNIQYAGQEVPIVFKDEVFEDVRQVINIEIPKYDAETKEQIAGAKFGLYADADIVNVDGAKVVSKGTLIATSETILQDNEVTKAVFNVGYSVDGNNFTENGLPNGRYYVKEIEAPEGYLLSNDRVEIDARYKSSNEEISFIGNSYNSNYKIVNTKAKVVVIPMDYDTEVELDGVDLEVSDSSGKVVANVKSKNGVNEVITGLKIGETYKVRVVKPREGYSNEVAQKVGFVSPYEKNGYPEGNNYSDVLVSDIKDMVNNEVTFVVEDFNGVQIVNLFNKPIKSEIVVQKKGEVAVSNVKDGKLLKISYELSGLPDAKYDILAKSDIKNPDGYSEVVYRKGEKVATITTNEKGIASIGDLHLGEYAVKEVKAPMGYTRKEIESEKDVNTLSSYRDNYFSKDNFNFVSVATSLEYVNERQIFDVGGNTGNLAAGVVKYGIDGNKKLPISGAEFTLYAKENIVDVFGNTVMPAGTEIEKSVSGNDGRVIFSTDLPLGSYVIRETKSPYGYFSSKKVFEVDSDVIADDDTKHEFILNGEFKDYITSTKIYLKDTNTKNELEGATIQIENEKGEVVKTIVTDITGGSGIEVKGLNPGEKYTIREIAPRDGYTTTIIIPNDMTGVIERVTKSSVSFTIPEVSIEEDESNLPNSTEIVLENDFVTGKFDIEKSGEGLTSVKQTVTEKTFLKKVIDWVKTIFKYESKPLDGAEFTVYANEDIYHPDGVTGLIYHKGDIVTQNVKTLNDVAVGLTDKSGYLQFKGMYLGKYVVVETNVPAGFIKNNTRTEVVLSQLDNTTQEVNFVSNLALENVRQKVNISMEKQDNEDGTTLEGAVFGLYNRNNIVSKEGKILVNSDSLIETVVTDKDGKATFEADLPQGIYYILELVPPKGYVSSEKEEEVDATHNPEGDETLNFDVVFKNDVTKTLINFMDYDTNVELDDVIYQIVDENGNIVKEITSKHGQNVLVKGLDPSISYKIVEKEAKSGYYKEVLLKDDYTSEYVNEGFTSGTTKYSAIDAYVNKISSTEVKFIPDDSGEVQVISIFNKPMLGSLKVMKKGNVPHAFMKDGMLEGIDYVLDGIPNTSYSVYAEQDIMNPDGYSDAIITKGTRVESFVTDANGEYTIEGLYLGEYRVVEDKAPSGYVRDENNCSKIVSLIGNSVMNVEFVNDNQKVDLGVDLPVKDSEDLETRDPYKDLYGKTGVIKYCMVNGKEVPVAGAEFTLYAKEDITNVHGDVIIPKDTPVTSAVTDESGRAGFDKVLPIGIYYARETKTPNGYNPTNEEVVYDGTVFADSEKVEIIRLTAKVGNDDTKALISMKDYNTDNEIDGVTYRILDEEGNVVGEWTSIHGKNDIIRGLEVGKQYRVVVATPREHYSDEILLKEGYTSEYVDNGYTLNGRHYDAVDNSSMTADKNIATFVLESVPEVQVINLFFDTYLGNLTVKKLGEVPETIIENGKVQTIEFKESGLPNTKYTVYAEEDILSYDGYSENLFDAGDKVADLVTNEKGIATLKSLHAGTYRVEETKAPEGYSRDENTSSTVVTVEDSGTSEVVFKNNVQKVDIGTDLPSIEGSLKDPFFDLYLKTGVFKYDTISKKAVKGSEFTLYAKEDIVDVYGNVVIPANTIVDVATSDENGRASFEKVLPIGIYYAKETKTPIGYNPIEEEIIFDGTVFKTNEDVEIIRLSSDVDNDTVKAVISIKDFDTKVELDGVRYRLIDINNEVVGEWSSVHGRNIVIRGLEAGKEYRVEVFKVREGYHEEVFSIDNYESDYVNSGYDVVGNHYDAVDVKGIKVNNTVASFTLDETKNVQIVNLFNKVKKGTITVNKSGDVPNTFIKDGVVHTIEFIETPLQGSKFVITAKNDIVHPDGYTGVLVSKDSEVSTLVTNKGGTSVTDELYYGDYTVTEVESPDYYSLDVNKARSDVSLSEDNATVSYKNTLQKVDIGSDLDKVKDSLKDPFSNMYLKTGIYKYDEESGKAVKGAEFTLYAKEDILNTFGDVIIPKDTVVDIANSDDNGRAAFKKTLPVGVYYAKETKTPDGYVPSMEVVEFDADDYADNKDIEIIRLAKEVSNSSTKTVISIKDFSTEVELAGVEYRILDNENNVVGEWVSSYGTNDIIRGLEPNKQYRVEVVVPRDGYTSDLFKKDGYESDYSKNGYNLYGIHYNAKDVVDIEVSKNIGSFTIEDSNDVQVVNIFNKYKTGDITIKKSGEVAKVMIENDRVSTIEYKVEGLPNTKYSVYANEVVRHPDGHTDNIYEKGDKVKDVVTNEKGIVELKDLYYGKYRVEETDAPDGYSRNENSSVVVTVGDDVAEANFVNTLQKVDVGSDIPKIPDSLKDPNSDLYLKTGIYKYDGESKYPVEGAEFTLYAKEDIVDVHGNVIIPAETIVDKAVSDTEGRVAFTKALPIGVYYAKETKTPDGYTSSSDIIIFEGNKYATNEDVEIIRFSDSVVNKSTKVMVAIRDFDTKVELDDVVYRVLDNQDRVIGEWTSSHDKNVIIRGLELGKQYRVEVVTPRDKYTNDVFVDGGYESPYVADGYTLNGIEYKAVDVKGLKADKNIVSFSIEETDDVQVVNIFNKCKLGSIVITKEGEVAKPVVVGDKVETIAYEVKGLPNAEYVITAKEDIVNPDGYSENIYNKGDEVAKQVTDDTGKTGITGTLYYGEYSIKETKAPINYSRDDKVSVKSVVVGDDVNTSTVKYTNVLKKLDVGSNIPIIEESLKDPYSNLYGKTGIYKYDTVSKEPVKGAEFTLYAKKDVTDVFGEVIIPEGTVVDKAVSDEEGRVAFTKVLPLGVYYAMETKSPDGYNPYKDEILFDADSMNTNEKYEIIRMNDYVGNVVNKAVVSIRDIETDVELDGVEYRIKDYDGNILGTYTSVNDGNIVIKGLKSGVPYILEVVTPREGYTNKVNTKDGYVSPYVEDGFIDPSGKIYEAEDLKLGTKKLNTVKFVLKESEKVQVMSIFLAPVKADISVQKLGEVPKVSIKRGKVAGITWLVKGLPNTEYSVYAHEDILSPDGYSDMKYKANALVKELVTDDKGIAVLSDLYLGVYRVEETKAPEGYTRDKENCINVVDLYKEYKECYFDKGDFSTVDITVGSEFTNKRQIVDVGKDIPFKDDGSDPDKDLYLKTGIYKIGVDGRRETPVSGAEFSLYAKEDVVDVYGNTVIPKDTLVAIAISDETGRAAFNIDIPVGRYYVKETKAPEGYHISDEVIEWTADEWMSDEEVEICRYTGTIKNDISSVKVLLRDSITKNELGGATLQLVDDYGNVIDEVETSIKDEKEGVVLKGVTPGKIYHIVEKIPPKNYTNRIIIPDEMSDVLTRETRNDVIFSIKEGQRDASYVIENAFVTGSFNIDKYGEGLRCIRITDEEKYFLGNKIEWRKTQFGYKSIKLEGAVFATFAREDIYHPDGTTGLLFHKGDLVNMNVTTTNDEAVVTTDHRGKAAFTTLYLGEYEVKETEMPNGYVRNTIVTPVDLVYKDFETQDVLLEKDIVYVNKRQRINIEITKRDAEDNMVTVGGAVFGIYASEDIINHDGEVLVPKDGLIETVVTDENGVGKFEADFPLGKYYVKELQAPEGYTSSSEIIKIDASQSQDCRDTVDYLLTFKNEQTKTMISFMDYETNVELDGVEYDVIDSKGSVVASLTSDNGNNTILRGLKFGEAYSVVEKLPRAGYSNVILTKEDFESEWSKNGIIRDEVEYTASDLVPYLLDRNIAKFKIKDVGGIQVVNIFNKSVDTDLTVRKEGEVPVTSIKEGKLMLVRYDIEGLPGAEFSVFAEEDIPSPDGYTENVYSKGDLVDKLVTDEEGLATISDIPMGKYRVVETKAPYGYARDYANSEKVFDLTKYYSDEHFDSSDFVDEMEYVGTFTNIRQEFDIGKDYLPKHDGVDVTDPNKDNFLKSGIIKLGVAGEEKIGIEGAVFHLFAKEDIVSATGEVVVPKDTFIEEAVSDANGRVRFDDFDLPSGRYKAVEVEAPFGCYPSDEEFIFDTSKLNTDDEVQMIRQSIEVENDKSVTKVFLYDDLTTNELSEAVIRILNSDGQVVETINTVDTKGEGAVIYGLNPGDTYVIEEIVPRYGYTNTINIPDEMKDVLSRVAYNKVSFTVPNIKGNDVIIKLTNSFVTGSFMVQKFADGLMDVQSVTEERSFSYRVYTWMKSNFNYGSIVAPKVEFTAYASEDIYHPDGKTGIIYEKGDKVRLNVRTINNEATLLTDNSGLASFEYMYLGKYNVRESSINAGYIRNNTVKEVSLQYADYVTKNVVAEEALDFHNTKQKANITVMTKDIEDESARPSGAIYGLYTKNEIRSSKGNLLIEKDSLIETLATSERGFGVFESDIPFGDYYIKEIEPAIGYDSSDEVKEFSFTGDRSGEAVLETNMVFNTERTKTVIALMDYDTEVELSGINLAIYDARGNLVERFATEKGNNYIVRGLEHNVIYTLVEETPNFGYDSTLYMKKDYQTPYKEIGFNDREYKVFDATDLGITSLNKNVAQFSLRDRKDVQIISLFNKPVIGGIRITTSGDVARKAKNGVVYYDGGLPGMEYTITAKEDIKCLDGVSADIHKAGDVIGTVVTDENGVAAITGLYLGTYEVKETGVVNGYVENEVKTVSVDIADDYAKNYYNPENHVVPKFYSDVEYSNEIQKVDIGIDRGTLDSVKDPENYLFGRTGITVFGKVGGRSELVSGAEYTLYAKKKVMDVYGNVLYDEGEEVAKAISDPNGRVRFLCELPSGLYVAKETKKADGFAHFEGEVVLDVVKHVADSKVMITRASGIVNTEASETRVTLIDDMTNKELEGAVVHVLDKNGRVVKEMVTGSNNVVTGLAHGETYYLEVAIPREGYTSRISIPNNMSSKVARVSDYKVSFVVPEDGKLDVTIANSFIVGSILIAKNGQVLDTVSQTYWGSEYLGHTVKWMNTYFGYINKGMSGFEYTVYADEDIYHPDGVTGLIYKKGDIVKTNVRGNSELAVATSDITGHTYFGGLYLGRYVVKETKAIHGYTIDSTEFRATLSYGDGTKDVVTPKEGLIEYQSTRKPVSISVVRKDKSNTVVNGSVIGLFAKDDILSENGEVLIKKDSLLETKMTSGAGTIAFSADLPSGWYYVKEIVAPNGVEPIVTPVDVEATSDDGSELIHRTVVIQ